MAPWCNRIAAQPVDVEGTTVNLQSNFRDGTAIHGQVYAAPWSIGLRSQLVSGSSGERSEFSVAGGGNGWPWRYSVGMQVTVVGPELRVELRLDNQSDARMPAGVGLHPWFVGKPEVAIDASLAFDSNTDSPAQPRLVAGDLDRRALQLLPPGLDATWTRPGNPPVRLRWPHLGLEADMIVDSASSYICAASPTDIDAVAVEPQTHGPDGLRRLINDEPGALSLVEPSGLLTMAMTLSFRRTEEDRQ